ncbi:MAG: tRNA (adenosine(37)-N6)-threonylcarbamoyltransferase complex ATPase subunit type 1 TsaE [Patescibacteria group bacterium]
MSRIKNQESRIKNFKTVSSSETQKLGVKIANTLRGGEVILLHGDLGSGKTTFTKGLAKALGIKQTITSPTFVLMKIYPTKHKTIKQLVHIDCYRVPGQDLLSIGLTEYLGKDDTVIAIEWAEKIPKLSSKLKTIKLFFKHNKELGERIINLKN